MELAEPPGRGRGSLALAVPFPQRDIHWHSLDRENSRRWKHKEVRAFEQMCWCGWFHENGGRLGSAEQEEAGAGKMLVAVAVVDTAAAVPVAEETAAVGSIDGSSCLPLGWFEECVGLNEDQMEDHIVLVGLVSACEDLKEAHTDSIAEAGKSIEIVVVVVAGQM